MIAHWRPTINKTDRFPNFFTDPSPVARTDNIEIPGVAADSSSQPPTMSGRPSTQYFVQGPSAGRSQFRLTQDFQCFPSFSVLLTPWGRIIRRRAGSESDPASTCSLNYRHPSSSRSALSRQRVMPVEAVIVRPFLGCPQCTLRLRSARRGTAKATTLLISMRCLQLHYLLRRTILIALTECGLRLHYGLE